VSPSGHDGGSADGPLLLFGQRVQRVHRDQDLARRSEPAEPAAVDLDDLARPVEARQHTIDRQPARACLLALVLLLLAFPPRVAAQAGPDPFSRMSGWSLTSAAGSVDTSPCPPLSLLRTDEPVPCSAFRLNDGGGVEPSPETEPSSERLPAIQDKTLRMLAATGVAIGSVAGGALNSFTETPHHSFHFTSEGFFGQGTYVGGADKASHFVDYAIVSKELANLYGVMGFSRGDSILLGFGVAVATGLMNEVGDGTNPYGFSWEDATMDMLGAGASAAIAAMRLEDLVGFRHGLLLPLAGNKTCCAQSGQGRDYSNEIYTADLHLAGVARRFNLKIGPLRYLLFSATYGTKGYPSGVPELRERQVGLEIGLDFEVILNDLGAKRNTWWGYGLHVILDNFRVPFTSIGYRYDLNHGRWTGPDNGNGFAAR